MSDDTESDNVSTVSSSEVQSDSDLSAHQDNPEPEMSPEELEKLAQFTTGAPLIRYDCPPSECPQCLSELFATQYYYGIPNYAVDENKNEASTTIAAEDAFSEPTVIESEVDENESDIFSTQSDTLYESADNTTEFRHESTQNAESESNRNPEEPHHSRKTQRQLLDIDIAGRGGKYSSDHFSDSVYIDLTDTDVTFTVYYHHELSAPDDSSVTYTAATSHTYLPSAASYQMLAAYQSTNPYASVPYWYHWPYMLTVPTPMYMSPDPLSLPKTLMIPPKELEKCKFTIVFSVFTPRNSGESSFDTSVCLSMCVVHLTFVLCFVSVEKKTSTCLKLLNRKRLHVWRAYSTNETLSITQRPVT